MVSNPLRVGAWWGLMLYGLRRAKMIRHIVALRFQDGCAQSEKDAIFADLAALRDQIGGILAFDFGPNVSIEPLSRGFEDVFCFDFQDVGARDAYLIHPAHQAVGGRIVAATGGIEGVFVFDLALP
jgi:Stress responsive A/B Barrel Domain